MKTLTDLPSGQLSPDLPAADLRDALVGSGDQGREHVYVGAHITGELDLRWCTVTVPINFKKCTFDSALQLAGAQLASLRLQGGTIAGLDAAHTHFTGDVEMSGGLHVAGQLDLSNSKVDGTLCLMDIAVDERKLRRSTAQVPRSAATYYSVRKPRSEALSASTTPPSPAISHATPPLPPT